MSAFYPLIYIDQFILCNNPVMCYFPSTLQKRKLRQRGVNLNPQGHTAGK